MLGTGGSDARGDQYDSFHKRIALAITLRSWRFFMVVLVWLGERVYPLFTPSFGEERTISPRKFFFVVRRFMKP